MQHQIETIPLAGVDAEDATYRITTRSDPEDLIGSMRRVGVLHPPVLEKRTDRYVPVSGFRRIRACRALHWETVPARVLDRPAPNLQSAVIAVCDNALQRPLNLIETARAVKMLAGYVPGHAERVRLVRDAGLPSNPRHMDKLVRLLDLSPSVQTAVAEDIVSLSVALQLVRLAPEAADCLCRLFRDLKLGFNTQQEMFTLVEEISEREAIAPLALLRCTAVQSIATHKDYDSTQKRQAIRKYLKKRRYPHLTTYEDRFASLRRNLNLGPHLQLTPPPHFEGNAYTLTVRFSSLTELTERTESLKRLAADPFMEKILAR